MIRHVHVENYRCLRDVSVDLGALTVLIGANDSGKSSLLDAIRVIGRTTSETIAESLAPEDGERADAYDALVWGHEIERRIRISIEGTAGSKRLGYSLLLRTGPGVVEERLDGGGCWAIPIPATPCSRPISEPINPTSRLSSPSCPRLRRHSSTVSVRGLSGRRIRSAPIRASAAPVTTCPKRSTP